MAALVVLGPAGAGKKALAHGVAALLSSRQPDAPVSLSLAEAGQGVLAAPLALTTKYYTAQLSVRVLPADAFAAPHADEWEGSLKGVEAAVVVLDATAPLEGDGGLEQQLLLASAWAERLAAHEAIATLAVVSNKADVASGGLLPSGAAEAAPVTYGTAGGEEAVDSAGSAAPAAEPPAAYRAHVSRVSSWAVDNGFEHIEGAAASLPLVGAAARDKAGVPRLLEALEATMWSNMVRSTAPRGLFGGGAASAARPAVADTAAAGASAAAAASDAAPAAAGGSLFDGLAVLVPNNGAAEAGSSGAPAEAAAASSAALAAVEASGEPPSAAALLGVGEEPPAAKAPAKGGASAPAAAAGDADADPSADIERLMESMRAVKTAAQGGKLSDEARREAAAAMAMRLLALMGDLGDDEGEDGDGEGQA